MKEIDQYKLTVSQREEEIETLSQQLQEKEAFIAKLEQKLSAAWEGGAQRQLDLEEHVLKVTDEAAGLREKLEEAEEGKQEAVREMETAQMECKWLQSWMTEPGEQQTAIKVSSVLHYYLSPFNLEGAWRSSR